MGFVDEVEDVVVEVGEDGKTEVVVVEEEALEHLENGTRRMAGV